VLLTKLILRHRYFILLSFNGTKYHGWQIQENGITVQSVLNRALSQVSRSEIETVGAGRTDTGVHASKFIAHFDIEKHFSFEELNDLAYKLNSNLPNEIAIDKIFKVKEDVHARFSALSRTYKYYISPNKNPFKFDSSYFYKGSLDLELMNDAAKILFEYIDFTSFSKLHTQTKTNNCKIYIAEWQIEEDMIVFTIKADRFLRNMVRAIVGTLLDVGRGKIDIQKFREIIDMKSRCEAGFSVPANGLFLVDIEYPEDIFINA
jgi:tRNA pseudouridine38-40 synthase